MSTFPSVPPDPSVYLGKDGDVLFEVPIDSEEDPEAIEARAKLRAEFAQFDPYRHHDFLYRMTRIWCYEPYAKEEEPDEPSMLRFLFETMAGLCDPYTQPSSTGESNEFILSLDFVSNILLALCLEKKYKYFDICISLTKIIERICIYFNCYDELKMPEIDDVFDNTKFLSQLNQWTPPEYLYMRREVFDEHDLQLLFTIISLSFYTIGNTYTNYLGQTNISLNPFLHFFIKYWKIHTKVVILGIEFDRECEQRHIECPSPEYPEIIRHMIKGSSAVRNVLLIMLNDEFDKRMHDLKHESLINFHTPWGRRSGNGSLKCDIRFYVSSMLSMGESLLEVTSLMVNLEPDDKYDEDINYIFDYELDNEDLYEKVDEDELHEEAGGVVVNGGNYELHPDCHCTFSESIDDESVYDDKTDNDSDDNNSENGDDDDKVHYKYLDNNGAEMKYYEMNGCFYSSETGKKISEEEFLIDLNPILQIPHQVLLKNDEEEQDEKWADIVRGDNVMMSKEFEKLNRPPCTLEEVKKIFEKLTNDVVGKKEGEKVVKTIAFVVLEDDNDESLPMRLFNIYQLLVGSDFHKLISLNPSILFQIVDEMMMAPGYRRPLIWFLTHLHLSLPLIQYFLELVIEKRDVWSRVGNLQLSEIEIKMIIHEFLANATVSLSKGTMIKLPSENVESEEKQTTFKAVQGRQMIKLICVMIQRLMEVDILTAEYHKAITTLLFPWSFIVNEAKDIYQRFVQPLDFSLEI